MVTILLGLSNSADPFFSDRNLENSGPSSGSVRNFFSIFFNRLDVSQVFFHSAARLVATKKTEFQFFRIPDGHKVPSQAGVMISSFSVFLIFWGWFHVTDHESKATRERGTVMTKTDFSDFPIF